MATTYKYTNELSAPITESQLETIGNYQRLKYINGFLKLIERYTKIDLEVFKNTTYYLEEGENKTSIIQQYSNGTNESCTVYFNRQASGVFSLWDWEDYDSKKNLKFRGKAVLGANDRHYAIVNLNLSSNYVESASKYFYGNKVAGKYDDLLLIFTYESTGDLFEICDYKGEFGYMKSIDLSQFLKDTQFSQVDFPWDQNPYYHNLYPLLPTQ